MKLREYFFVPKENKNNDFIQQFLLFRVSLRCALTTVQWHMRVHSSACKQGTTYRVLRQNAHRRLKLLSSHYFSFLCAQQFSRSFIKLRLNLWCHSDYFNDVLNVSVALLSMHVQKALIFNHKYPNLCSEDERRSYRFETTWGIFI